MNQDAFVSGWGEIARMAAVGVAAYVALVLMLRVSGKRTLSKLTLQTRAAAKASLARTGLPLQ